MDYDENDKINLEDTIELDPDDFEDYQVDSDDELFKWMIGDSDE